MRIHSVPAGITVAPAGQFADVLSLGDRANADLVKGALIRKDFAAEIEELYR